MKKKICILLLMGSMFNSNAEMVADTSIAANQFQDEPTFLFNRDNSWQYLEKFFEQWPNQEKKDVKALTILTVIGGLCLATVPVCGMLSERWWVSFGSTLAFWTVVIGCIELLSYVDYDVDQAVIERFLQNYDPDVTKKAIGQNPNNKLLVPQELIEVFDALYLKYKKDGIEYLKKDGVAILNDIRERIYHNKPQKYYQPNIQVRVIS